MLSPPFIRAACTERPHINDYAEQAIAEVLEDPMRPGVVSRDVIADAIDQELRDAILKSPILRAAIDRRDPIEQQAEHATAFDGRKEDAKVRVPVRLGPGEHCGE